MIKSDKEYELKLHRFEEEKDEHLLELQRNFDERSKKVELKWEADLSTSEESKLKLKQEQARQSEELEKTKVQLEECASRERELKDKLRSVDLHYELQCDERNAAHNKESSLHAGKIEALSQELKSDELVINELNMEVTMFREKYDQVQSELDSKYKTTIEDLHRKVRQLETTLYTTQSQNFKHQAEIH